MDHYIRFNNNRYNFAVDSAQCPPVPTLPANQLATEAKTILEAAGAQACHTEASIQQAEAQFSGSSVFGSISGGVKASNSDTSAIGCEQLAVIANKYNKAVQNVACILKTSKHITTTTVKGVNNINFESTDGGVTINCGKEGLDFKQKMNLKVISNINLSNEELTQITNDINDVVKTTVQAVQDSTSGIGATPQGNKAISDTITNINSIDQKNKIDEKIKEVINNISGTNSLTVKGKESVLVEGKNCKISQEMVIELVANQIVKESVSDSLSSISKTVSETESSVSQKSVNKGAEELALKIKDTSVSPMAYVMIAIIAIVLIGALYMLGSKLGAKALDKMPAQRYYRRK